MGTRSAVLLVALLGLQGASCELDDCSLTSMSRASADIAAGDSRFEVFTGCTTKCHSFARVSWTAPAGPVAGTVQMSVTGQCVGGVQSAPFTGSFTTSPAEVNDFNIKNLCGDMAPVTYTVGISNTSGQALQGVLFSLDCPGQ
jgi:hypothetical protein